MKGMNKYTERLLLQARKCYKDCYSPPPADRVECPFCTEDRREQCFVDHFPIPLLLLKYSSLRDLHRHDCGKCPMINLSNDNGRLSLYANCVGFGSAVLEKWEGFFDE